MSHEKSRSSHQGYSLVPQVIRGFRVRGWFGAAVSRSSVLHDYDRGDGGIAMVSAKRYGFVAACHSLSFGVYVDCSQRVIAQAETRIFVAEGAFVPAADGRASEDRGDR